jgi:transcriptional regulator with XRE-family HTH domain
MKKTGETIRRLRKERGVKMYEIQAAMGFSTPQAIFKWERGICLPKLENIVILADVLGVDKIEDILSIEDA